MAIDGEKPASSKRLWIGLAAIVFIAFALRLTWALMQPTDEQSLKALPDQAEYLQIARNVLDGRGFVFYDPVFRDNAYAYRLPGYPLLIAACGAKITIVRVVQAGLDASTVLAAFLLARHLAGNAAGLLSAVIVTLHPYFIYFSGTLLSETLFTAMLAWGMWLLLGSSRWRFLTGALLLVLSIYVRPSAIALPILLAVGAQLVRVIVRTRSFWQLPVGAGVLILSIICLSPWLLRNRQVLNTWVLTTNSGVTMYDGFNPRADGSSNQYFRNWPELKAMNEVQRSAYLSRMASDYASAHPRQAIRLAGAKIARTWSPMPLSEEYGSNRLYVLVGLGFMVPLYAMAIAGLTSPRINRSVKLYLLLPAVYFTLVHAMTVGSLRYRVPADVPLAVLAAVGILKLTADARPAAAPVAE